MSRARTPAKKGRGKTDAAAAPRAAWPEKHLPNFLILAVFTAIVFREVFLHPGQMLWGSDLIRLDSVYKYLEWRSFREWGTFPLWDPTAFGGMSRVGDQGPILFTPFMLLFWISSSPWFFGFYEFTQVVLGTWGMFLFSRRKDCTAAGAFFAAIAFAFCARSAGHLYAGHIGMVPAVLALPWILWAADRVLERKSVLSGVYFGAVYALAALNGPSAQVMYYHGLFLAGFVLVELVARRAKGESLGQSARALLVLGLGGILFLLLAAPWWLPVTRQSLALAARAQDADMLFSLSGSADWSDLLRLVWPFAGVPYPEVFRSDAAHDFFWATGSFAGVTTLVLAAARIGTAFGSPRATGYTLLGVLFALMALGGSTPLYALAWHAIPGFSLFRVPGRLFLYTDFVLAMLAAQALSRASSTAYSGAVLAVALVFLQLLVPAWFGIQGTALAPSAGAWLPFFVLALISLLAALRYFGALSTGGFMCGCIALLALEMLAFWSPQVRSVEVRQALRPSPVARYLEQRGHEEGEFRVLDTTGDIQQHTAVRYGLEIVTGYRAGVYGHFLDMYNRIWRSDDSDAVEVMLHPASDIACPAILDLMNVRYLVSGDPALPSPYKRVFSSPFTDPRDALHVYRRDTAMPRAYVVPRAVTPAGGYSVPDALCGMDPRSECLVETGGLEGGAAYQPLTIKRQSESDITLDFTTGASGVVVVSQSWHPDWRATDMGGPVEVIRVNHGQVGIPVGAGGHRLRVYYYPWDLYLGLGLAAAGLLAVAAISMYGFMRGRGRAHPHDSSTATEGK